MINLLNTIGVSTSFSLQNMSIVPMEDARLHVKNERSIKIYEDTTLIHSVPMRGI